MSKIYLKPLHWKDFKCTITKLIHMSKIYLISPWKSLLSNRLLILKILDWQIFTLSSVAGSKGRVDGSSVVYLVGYTFLPVNLDQDLNLRNYRSGSRQYIWRSLKDVFMSHCILFPIQLSSQLGKNEIVRPLE